MQPPSSLNNTSTTTSSSSILCNKVHIPINTQSNPVNTEEFAKLDALLEDLLAEVEQPILLNKQDSSNFTSSSSSSQWANQNTNPPQRKITNNLNDIERSVDWLNEQKEILRTRKYQNNNEVHEQNEQPYRKVKTKLDYYLSSSNNGDGLDGGAKPPVSPNSRMMYSSPSGSSPLHQQQTVLLQPQVHQSKGQYGGASFRSLSTNPNVSLVK